MARAAGAAAAVRQLAGVFLGELDQLRERVHRHVLADHEDHRACRDRPDRSEILARIVAGVGKKRRPHAHRAAVGNAECVAVRRASRERLGGKRAAGPAAILHDELLTETTAHAIRYDTSDSVVAPARRCRDNQRDRPGRVVLRLCSRGDGRECEYEQQDLHKHFPFDRSTRFRSSYLAAWGKPSTPGFMLWFGSSAAFSRSMRLSGIP